MVKATEGDSIFTYVACTVDSPATSSKGGSEIHSLGRLLSAQAETIKNGNKMEGIIVACAGTFRSYKDNLRLKVRLDCRLPLILRAPLHPGPEIRHFHPAPGTCKQVRAQLIGNMTQAVSVPAQDDYFMGDWPGIWPSDPTMGSFEVQPGSGIFTEPTPSVNAAHDLVARGDVRSLLIMICSRLDKIENSVVRAETSSAQVRDSMERNIVAGTQVKEMIDSLRKSMGAFSKALFAFLRGDKSADGKLTSAG
ncbi:hypothetical protein LZ30DRAFT_124602 [Colletotrichum cereale]|nr:hypothetical protein LZ30DRAFT_124602 [Colletotrichum cereale]